MEDKNRNNLPHLFLKGTSKTERYTSPLSIRDSRRFPDVNRQSHAAFLIGKIESVQKEDELLKKEKIAYGVDAGNGLCLQFESAPEFPLKIESLESLSQGIELLAVKEVGGKTYATVLVPEGKLAHFVGQIEKYQTEQTKKGNPRYQPLVSSISDIHRAAIEALWTDDRSEFPVDQAYIWWEVWLRAGKNREATLNMFKRHASQLGLRVGNGYVSFPDRTIVLVYANKEQMSKSVDLLNCIAELRKAKETADPFVQMPPAEQFEWVKETLSRLSAPDNTSSSVCILDTGINNGHPLISPALSSADMHAYDPSWNVYDEKGHGTEMAGLALYGDLIPVLLSRDFLVIPHVLESVKILPPRGQNDPKLYGHVTAESIARAEISAPQRKRCICLAVTTTDFRDRGKPSSWSAAIDSLCSGADDGEQRLIIISGGNTNPALRANFPDCNLTDEVHDPGQAWNALTVGAYTEKTNLDQSQYPGWSIISPSGDLSPSSCTSMTWAKQWPAKPDIVLEGGNMAVNHASQVDNADSLQLLSTYFQPLSKMFVTTGETSAAAALASRMAAILHAAYPDLWPETTRALLVHSADWTNAMKARFGTNSRADIKKLLRYCGFGVPDLKKAMWSASNSLTLIVQDLLQPFEKYKDGVKTCDMHLHELPWPIEVLHELGETTVEMRVTLSYFIEPNPARRGWIRRHRYASHGLRFDVKTPTESNDDFRRRINKAARDEDVGKTSDSDSSEWLLGRDIRGQGSIHSDRWKGTAADLASRGVIGVYPVIGWWRERHQLGRWNRKARYALVVTIQTPESEVDIYTPVANTIKTPISIKI
ncbi:MAG: S8 family peptidase [Thermodesulfovibrionales bacterium]